MDVDLNIIEHRQTFSPRHAVKEPQLPIHSTAGLPVTQPSFSFNSVLAMSRLSMITPDSEQHEAQLHLHLAENRPSCQSHQKLPQLAHQLNKFGSIRRLFHDVISGQQDSKQIGGQRRVRLSLQQVLRPSLLHLRPLLP